MRAFVNAANLLSSASLGAGFLALVLAGDGRLHAAAAAVGVAALLDAADGTVARRMSLSGRFGLHLDSLADLVAFGAAPALILHRAAADTGAVAATAAGLVFVVAGAWRLARYQTAPDAQRLEGLPIPLAGLALAGATLVLPAMPALLAAVALAALMVSAIPVPTVGELTRIVRGGRPAGADGGGGAAPGGSRSRETPLPRAGGRRRPRVRRLGRPARWRTRP